MTGELVPRQSDTPQTGSNEQFELNLSTGAQALLDEVELGDGQRHLVEGFLMARLWQGAFWNSDVSAGDREIARVAAQTEVTHEMMQEAIRDVTDPELFEMHMFLNALAASGGNIDMCMTAYERRQEWQTANGKEIKLTEQAVAHYARQLSIMFCAVFDQAMDGNEEAKELLRMLMPDFGNMPQAANYKGWLQRKMLNAIAEATNDFTMMQFRDRFRNEPGLFDKILAKLLDGEDLSGEAGNGPMRLLS